MAVKEQPSQKSITINNAKILFRNLSGLKGQYNAEGDRNFCVIIDEDLAEVLVNDGWNVRWLRPREEGDRPTPYIQVKANYNNPRKQPKIVLVTSRGKTVLNESTVNQVDFAEIEYVDLIINPYFWEVNGKSGIKPYVKSMFITIAEDELEKKYYDTPHSPDSAISHVGGCGNCEECDGSCNE